ncbi:hypothetical protein [Frigoriglobus tundricola]|uniref:Uncharacterized protein n=1 Tax=Frigoriglobus tundricola TaxID=2774151 RepID=A0A6M5YJ61_9BACT|nr:hypothetical protein [Frigoriglobus tundricola]QJW93381.1 hypothetical protein FTUN_0887 [Frigoriglobus tundricola]
MRHISSYRWAGAAVTALGLFATVVLGQPPRPGQTGPTDPIGAAKAQQSIAEQKFEAEIRQTIENADKLAKSNRTDNAARKLKQSKLYVQGAVGISDDARTRFTAMLDAELAVVEGRPVPKPNPMLQLDPKLPELKQAKGDVVAKYLAEVKDVREGIQRVEQAQNDKDTAKANAEIARLTKLYPTNPSVFALRQNDSMKDRLTIAQTLYVESNQRWLENQRSIEKSALPPIGDIEFPPDWKEKSARRLKSNAIQVSDKEKKIIEALDKPITVAFAERPLEEALQDLSNALDQPLLVDRKSLEDLGLDLKKGVSIQGKGLSGRTVLRSILATQGLTFVVKDEQIQIVTVERSKTLLTTRVYYIGDLVQAGQYSGIEWGPLLNAQQAQGNLAGIIDAIKKIDPLSWSGRDTAGPGTVTYHAPTQSIIVRNSAEVHFSLGRAFGAGR